MLAKSSLSNIRRLISQRKEKEDGEEFMEYGAALRAEHAGRPESWMSTRETRRKAPPTPIVIWHVETFDSVPLSEPRPAPRIPDTPPLSSSGSLSCESRADGPPRTPRTPGTPRTSHSRQSSKSLSPNSRASPQSSRQQTVTNRMPVSGQVPRRKPLESSPRPSLNLPEKQNHFTTEEETTRRVTVDPARLEGWSESVQQLIRDTDQAFKIDSTGLLTPEHHAFVSGSRKNSLDKDLPPLPLRTPEDRSRPSTSSSTTKRPETPKIITTPNTPLPPPPPAAAQRQQMKPPTKKPSASTKEKKQKEKRSARQKPLFKSRLAAPKHHHHPRWTLGENVAELFSGFKKIEADEMITPEDVEEFRRNRLSAMRPARHQKSSESLLSEAAEAGGETPIEPFHLDDLPTRIGAAGVKTALTPIDPPTRGAQHVDSAVLQDFPAAKKAATSAPTKEEIVISPLSPVDAHYDLPIQSNVEVDIPIPPKNPARLSRKKLGPAIPEVMVTSPENRRHRPTSTIPFPTLNPFAPAEDDNYFYFKSTPCTLTQPGLQHGAIRFSKADLNMKKATADNTLDWTAFQMAILGGVGDYYTGSSDWLYGQHTDDEEAENLAEWFADFNFETAGQLITEDDLVMEGSPSSCEYNSLSPISTSGEEDCYDEDELDDDEVPTELDLPIPVVSEHPGGFWNEGRFDSSKFVTRGCGIKRWTVEGHPKPYTSRGSMDSTTSVIPSLPQSPMMPLVVTKSGSESSGVEVVPMGYNLGHDLGDFLRWEAEHMYAGGEYNDRDF